MLHGCHSDSTRANVARKFRCSSYKTKISTYKTNILRAKKYIGMIFNCFNIGLKSCRFGLYDHENYDKIITRKMYVQETPSNLRLPYIVLHTRLSASENQSAVTGKNQHTYCRVAQCASRAAIETAVRRRISLCVNRFLSSREEKQSYLNNALHVLVLARLRAPQSIDLHWILHVERDLHPQDPRIRLYRAAVCTVGGGIRMKHITGYSLLMMPRIVDESCERNMR